MIGSFFFSRFNGTPFCLEHDRRSSMYLLLHSRVRRPGGPASGTMGVKGRALVCLSMVVQSRAFTFAPSTRRGPLDTARPSASAPSRTSVASALMAYDVKYSPNRWRDEGDIVPGFGGIWPGDPDAETYQVSGTTRGKAAACFRATAL